LGAQKAYDSEAMLTCNEIDELEAKLQNRVETLWYLHIQDKACWTYELQLTFYPSKPGF
jgi:hypothetical protein